MENQLHISTEGHTEQEIALLQECILNSPDIFALGSEPGRVDLKIAEHSVSTGDYPPIKSALCLERRGDKMINNMIAENVVQLRVEQSLGQSNRAC